LYKITDGGKFGVVLALEMLTYSVYAPLSSPAHA
jgi:hypothetical protein